MLTAEELHRRAVEAVNHGRVRLAGRLLERAAERSTDPDFLARLGVSRAYVAMELGDLETATRLCRESLARQGLRPADRGVALAQLAMLHMRAGQMTDALAAFSEGIALLGELPADRARALGNRGDVYLHQGRLPAAVDDFRAAAEAFATAGLDVEQAKAEHNLGYALMLGGDLIGALDAMSAAYPVLAPVSPVLRAVCTQDRAEVLLAMGLDDEGAELLRRAARDYGARSLRQRQAEAELALARGLVVRDPASARRMAASARTRFARLGHDSWRARADAVVVAADVGLEPEGAGAGQPCSPAGGADAGPGAGRRGDVHEPEPRPRPDPARRARRRPVGARRTGADRPPPAGGAAAGTRCPGRARRTHGTALRSAGTCPLRPRRPARLAELVRFA